jgi:prepilin-type N-terminal cleavage/methylation domain-containing protein
LTDTRLPGHPGQFIATEPKAWEEANMSFRCPVRKAGFSLIELTVATAIYSMGLGSLSLMMLAELILMNPAAIGHYISDVGGAAPDCDGGIVCAPDEMAAWHLQAWRDDLAALLPGGSGLVCLDSSPEDGESADAACDGVGGPVIKVLWEVPEDEDDPEPGFGRQVARLPVP